jgi:hypothetical protein
MTERQRILIQTATDRDKVEALLRELIDAKATSERNMAQIKQPDFLKQVTGKSSLDNAIANTQRMVETLNRTLEQFKRELSDEDLALLDEPRG